MRSDSASAGASAGEPDLRTLKEDIVFTAAPLGRSLTFRSTWGLFSPRGIDDGTAMLLRHADIRPGEVALDLGCGYGVIGLAIAAQSPESRVHLVDRDYVAVEYARRNAEANGLANCHVYLSNAFSAVPADVRFDHVAANLPAKVGKELLSIILYDARSRLRPGGRITVVTVNGLRKFIRRNLEQVFGSFRKLKQGPHHTVSMANVSE